MLTIAYDIQLVLDLEDDQTEPTEREIEVALEQSTAGEALTTALDDRAARLRLPLPKWAETKRPATTGRDDPMTSRPVIVSEAKGRRGNRFASSGPESLIQRPRRLRREGTVLGSSVVQAARN